ncbi:MAG: hypothetical protein HC781_06035 [Leptolyngbyaceae cyanobacterium CSU_1_4]|nr:hypothetical protein [Leptolyngbyaceae cyanobacterium CSU_1_4]
MKQYDYAVEYSKIFINLATVLLGLTLTFTSNVVGKESSRIFVLMMLVSWILWIASIYMGARSIAIIVTIVAASTDSVAGDEDEDLSSSSDESLSVFDRSLQQRLRWQRRFFIYGFSVAALSAFVSAFLDGT